MLAANKQKVLHALGIRSWVRQDRLVTEPSFSSFDKRQTANLPLYQKETATNSPFCQRETATNSPLYQRGAGGDFSVREDLINAKNLIQSESLKKIPLNPHLSKGEIIVKPFRLILQPLTHNTLIIANIHDPQAPGLSAQEQRLLVNICLAVSRCLALENPPLLSNEQNLFSWPLSTHLSLLADPQQAMDQALQGLIAAYQKKGFHQFFLLGEQISDLLSQKLESQTYYVSHGLQAMHQQPLLKRHLWQLLKQWMNQ